MLLLARGELLEPGNAGPCLLGHKAQALLQHVNRSAYHGMMIGHDITIHPATSLLGSKEQETLCHAFYELDETFCLASNLITYSAIASALLSYKLLEMV